MSEQKPIVETEIVDTPIVPCVGGFVESKNGQLCLRQGDEIHAIAEGGFMVVRQWLPPGDQPWSVDLYPIYNTHTVRGRL